MKLFFWGMTENSRLHSTLKPQKLCLYFAGTLLVLCCSIDNFRFTFEVAGIKEIHTEVYAYGYIFSFAMDVGFKCSPVSRHWLWETTKRKFGEYSATEEAIGQWLNYYFNHIISYESYNMISVSVVNRENFSRRMENVSFLAQNTPLKNQNPASKLRHGDHGFLYRKNGPEWHFRHVTRGIEGQVT